jgi:enoyl-CoA hydratase
VIDVAEQADVAVVTMDDGKANAMSFDLLVDLGETLQNLAERSKAVVLAGRPGLFCAGLDLRVVQGGDQTGFDELLEAGRELYRLLLRLPVPIVAACTGHALAGGALLLLCSDYRIGLRGDFRIGMHEVSIGVPIPEFGTRMAQLRLNRTRYVRAILLGELTGPDEAVEVGFLDEVAGTPADLLAAAVAKAEVLARLPREAYTEGKRITYTVPRALEGL